MNTPETTRPAHHLRCMGRMAYQLHAPRTATPERPTIVLAHALGCDHTMWDDLAEHLSAAHPVLRYDQYGHGDSDTPTGPYTMAQLADEAATLIEGLKLGPVIWIGLSMGGMIGQELALRHPAMVEALVLANTTSQYPPEAREGWNQRIQGIRQSGLEGIVDGALTRWFHEGFRHAHSATVAHWRRKVLGCRTEGYLACCEAIRDVDTFTRLPRIAVPTLVIAGELDLGTPPAMARAIASQIPRAQLAVLPEASHLSVLEQPHAFRDTVDRWLRSLPH